MTGISGSCNAVPSKRSRIRNLRQKKDQKTRLSGIPIPGIVSSLQPAAPTYVQKRGVSLLTLIMKHPVVSCDRIRDNQDMADKRFSFDYMLDIK